MRYAWLVLCFSGCQCLVPVNEFPPGENTDGGHIEPAPACNKPNDCAGDFKTVDWCWGDGGADWSCVDHRCVAQCQEQGGKTCESEASGCLKCPSTSACTAPRCEIHRDVRWRVEQISCINTPPLKLDDVLHQVPDGGCGVSLMLERDGGIAAFGELHLQSTYEFSGGIEMMGGTCLVSGLPTGVERLIFDCPRCQFVVANW